MSSASSHNIHSQEALAIEMLRAKEKSFFHSSIITFAPEFFATDTVLSMEPVSTTIISMSDRLFLH